MSCTSDRACPLPPGPSGMCNYHARMFSVDGTRLLAWPKGAGAGAGAEPDWRIECDETDKRRARQSHQRKMQTARVEAAR